MLRLPRWLLVTMTTSSNITIGIDEVGRGPWAGPLLVSAVALDMNQCYEGLADSKKLTKRRREVMAPYVQERALGIGLGWVDVAELDRLGMTDGLKLGAKRAYNQLPSDVTNRAERIVIDGNIKMLDDPRAVVMVKADAQVQAVSAASIVAKVARDSYMAQLDRLFPEYGFAKNAGYGVKQHSQALAQYGIVAGVHRTSFAPIKKLLGELDDKGTTGKIEQTAGRIAEGAAADYLISRGYRVIARNWRTKLCETDIIALKDSAICFVEVKYRQNSSHGDGLAAITNRKLEQMRFAAEMYMNYHGRQFGDCNPRLMAMALSGQPPRVDEVVEIGWC